MLHVNRQPKTRRILLAQLPCGCTVDRFEVNSITVDMIEEIIECPWCDVTFETGELLEYLDTNDVPLMYAHRQLATDGNRVLEVMGFCEDGHVIVRERCRGAQLEHALARLEVLRN